MADVADDNFSGLDKGGHNKINNHGWRRSVYLDNEPSQKDSIKTSQLCDDIPPVVTSDASNENESKANSYQPHVFGHQSLSYGDGEKGYASAGHIGTKSEVTSTHNSVRASSLAVELFYY